MHLAKDVQNLHSENYETLLKQILEVLSKGKSSYVHESRRPNTVKMAILPKLTSTFKAIPIKIPEGFFSEIDKLITNSYGNGRDPA